jgi:hypothetical protein
VPDAVVGPIYARITAEALDAEWQALFAEVVTDPR